jgi:NAD(P)-dependent dehydrogenase (short-subunit alcohol dehydrogenase family)
MQLTASRIVILGGSTGIGFATAKAASAEGGASEQWKKPPTACFS